MVKHNNRLVNNHFRKRWQERVKTWFNQPARKLRRRKNRALKAKRNYPRPASGLLRPIVRCPTQRYNTKVRPGRGFTLLELKNAGVNPLEAINIGISVDYRRNNHCNETLLSNVQRLKLYKSKLILYPRKAGKPKPGEASADDIAKVVQQKRSLPYEIIVETEPPRAITDAERASSAVITIRKARKEARRVGAPIRRARLEAAGLLTGDKKGDKKGGDKKGGDKKGGDKKGGADKKGGEKKGGAEKKGGEKKGGAEKQPEAKKTGEKKAKDKPEPAKKDEKKAETKKKK